MAYPTYYETKNFLLGDDAALAVVEYVGGEDEDLSFDLPQPKPFDSKIEELAGKKARISGYPFEIFNSKTKFMM